MCDIEMQKIESEQHANGIYLVSVNNKDVRFQPSQQLYTESCTKKRVVHRFLEYVHLETEMWYFSVAMALLTLAGGLVSAFVGVAMRQLGASFIEIGFVSVLYNLALAASSFFGGSLSRRYGGKNIFVAGLVCNLIGMLFYGATAIMGSWILIASGLLLGRIALGFRDTSSFAIVSSSITEKQRATAFGLLYAFSFAGSILASAIAAAIAFFFGYTIVFLIAIPFVILAMISVLLKLEKCEMNAERPVPSWKELKEALTFEKSVTFLLFIACWGQFFAEFGNPYYLIFMQENLVAPEYLLPMTQVTMSTSSLIAGLSIGHLSSLMKRRNLSSSPRFSWRAAEQDWLRSQHPRT